MLTVAQLMTHHADRVAPGATLAEAAALMVSAKISSVIVVDHNKVIGIVTERDMLCAMRAHRDHAQAITTIMTAPVHTVGEEANFRDAYRHAASLGIRHLVVADPQGKPLGVVTETDFRRHLGLDFFRQLNTVDTLMERNFPRLPVSALLDEALAAMESTRASCVIAVDGTTPLGIITERDVVRLYLENSGNLTLGKVMTTPVATIYVDAPMADAAQEMLGRHFRHLAVVDRNHRLVGLLSEHCLIRPLELDLLDDALNDRLNLSAAQIAAQERIARNERYQRALLDNFPFLVWLKDTESRFLAVNSQLAHAVDESSHEAMIGKTDLDYFPPDLAKRYRADDAAVIASGDKKYVIEQIMSHGVLNWAETYKAPVHNADGQVIGTVGFARDITDRQRAEEAVIMRNAALAGLLRGERLNGLLELIALSAEAELPGLRCAILLASEEGKRLHLGAAPACPMKPRQHLMTLPSPRGSAHRAPPPSAKYGSPSTTSTPTPRALHSVNSPAPPGLAGAGPSRCSEPRANSSAPLPPTMPKTSSQAKNNTLSSR